MESLQSIREHRFKPAVDVDWYDSRYAMGIWMSGYYQQCMAYGGIDAMRDQSHLNSTYEIPDYRMLTPEFDEVGLQNHGLVNSRINIQGVVNSRAKFIFKVEDPTQRQVLEAWHEDAWSEGDWSTAFLAVGMEVECCGIGAAVCTIGDDGGVTWQPSSIMDTIIDRAYRMPAQWRYMAHRVRMPIDDAIEMLGDLVPKRKGQSVEDAVLAYSRKRMLPYSRGFWENSTSNVAMPYSNNIQDDVVHLWYYSSGEAHSCFVGSIEGSDDGKRKEDDPDTLVLKWENGKYVPITDGNAGKNPLGVVPVAYWLDSWSPFVDRPSAKSETTIRLASMLNEIEKTLVKCARNGIPITVIDGGASPELAEKIKACVAQGERFDIRKLDEIIISEGGDIKDVIQRLPPVEIPAVYMSLRGILKQEMNPATGVMDMQRGQALTGDKTKAEVDMLADNQGVQARHLGDQYCKFLTQVSKVSVKVAAAAETKSRVLQLDEGPLPIGKKGFPLKPFMESVPTDVDRRSVHFMSDEDRFNQAVARLNAAYKLFVDWGVADPYKIATNFLREIGIRHPETILKTQEQMKAEQDAKKQTAEGAAHQSLREQITVALDKLPPDLQQFFLTNFFGAPQSMQIGQPSPDAVLKEQGQNERAVLGHVANQHAKVIDAALRPPPAPAAKAKKSA